MKIRTKVLSVFLPIILLSVGAMTLFSERAVEQVLVQEVSKRGLSISLNLARSRETVRAFQRGDERALLPPLQQVQENAGALYAMVVDPEGRVLAHTNVAEKGKLYADGITARAISSEQPEHARFEIDGRPAVDISFPVWEVQQTESGEEFLLLGRREVHARRRLGTVRVGLPLQEALETADRISGQVFWVITLVSLLVMGILLLYVRVLLLPIRSLARATERVGRGELGETVPVRSRDELGDLAASFNRMSRDLAATTVSKDFLDGVLRNMQDMLVVTDALGGIRLLNRRGQEMLDYREEELVGRPAAELVRGGEELFSPAGLKDLSGGGAVDNVDICLVTRAGAEVPVLLGAAAFLDRDGRVEGFIVNAVDITERKRAEEGLRHSLREKELLLKEIHHRVKNNLQIISSLLSLQSVQIDDEESLEMFVNSQNRVLSMALIHEKLYQSDDLARVNFSEYLESLTTSLMHSYQVNMEQVRLDVVVKGVLLGIDEAIPCGLIINELVLNALKHAFPDGRRGEIHISLARREDGRYELVVRDDGVGLPPDLDLEQVESLGLKLVHILVQQLDGEIQVRGERGTEFRIHFAAREGLGVPPIR